VLGGTIGQADDALLKGGHYALFGGFWQGSAGDFVPTSIGLGAEVTTTNWLTASSLLVVLGAVITLTFLLMQRDARRP
jgi:hypothetical protein